MDFFYDLTLPWLNRWNLLAAVLPNIVKYFRNFLCRERQNHTNIPICYFIFGYVCMFQLVIFHGPGYHGVCTTPYTSNVRRHINNFEFYYKEKCFYIITFNYQKEIVIPLVLLSALHPIGIKKVLAPKL